VKLTLLETAESAWWQQTLFRHLRDTRASAPPADAMRAAHCRLWAEVRFHNASLYASMILNPTLGLRPAGAWT
jgi:hypothetical protein